MVRIIILVMTAVVLFISPIRSIHFDLAHLTDYYEIPNPQIITMTRTIYTRDYRCVPGNITASGEKLVDGTAAINVTLRNKRWFYDSPLKMGDTVFIHDYGVFVVRDTGPLRHRNTIDLFMDIPYNEALEMGVKEVEVIKLY